MKTGKKAQAAIEFLSTYGWAVLVIVVVLVALGWLGVFTMPLQTVPDQCRFPIGAFKCEDLLVQAEDSPQGWHHLVSVTLTNNFGRAVKTCAIACDAGTDLTDGWPSWLWAGCNNQYELAAGQTRTITPMTGVLCADPTGRRGDVYHTGDKYVGKLYVSYFYAGQTDRRIAVADIVTTVQPGS
ncbi:MAG: hypothetical protein WC759_03550 [Candidatus Micrarchaeia archaeon]|jgi:hypothetical protein